MNQRLKYQIWLHAIIFVWGFTGILGKLISIPSFEITFWRMGIAFFGIGMFFLFKDFKRLIVPRKQVVFYLLTGGVVALHWTFFFEALHISNVSLTLSCLASASLFTAFLEPFFSKRKISSMEVVFGGVVVVGIYLIFQFQQFSVLGVVYALLSAFFASLFTVLNGLFIKTQRARVITFYEMLGGFLFLMLFMLFKGNLIDLNLPAFMDSIYILILGLVCTAIAFVVSVEVMKELSAFTVSLSINLEPIYSILLALIIFGDSEKMAWQFYVGAAIILVTVFANAFVKLNIKRRLHKKIKIV